MAQQPTAKKQNSLPKSFMTAGPTLHYSHANVHRCWLLAIAAFALTCLFWSKILTGSFFPLGSGAGPGQFWRLGRFVTSPLSIFEYPWQIFVLGLLMGVLAVVPVLVSQLFSFRYSVPFILAVAFLAGLGGFAICVCIGCIGAACRPLRFRSRFIAIALCMAPQILYWAFLGRDAGLEPIKWGFSFAPWVCAWLEGLVIAALVLGIGHFTRYRPGTVWVFTLLTIVLALWTFQKKIGFSELAYQRYIAKNNPAEVPQLHDRSITAALDKTIMNPQAKRFARFFYPPEKILLRAELKKDMQLQLRYDRWPSWFHVPPELNFQAKQRWLHQQYEFFINPPRPWWMPSLLYHNLLAKRAGCPRMPIALYYKALLAEYTPDIQLLAQKEVLHFYSDYPHPESLPIWYELYDNFGTSSESIEARWRIAARLAGQAKFQKAGALITEAQNMTAQRLKLAQAANKDVESFLTVFGAPADTAVTVFRLTELERKLAQLQTLISPENYTQTEQSRQRLAEFVILNPHSQSYAAQLNSLLAGINDQDPLRDNLLLAKTMLVADSQLRSKKLAELAEAFANTDGAISALYELALLKFRSWQQRQSQDDTKRYLSEARQTLTKFVTLYPESIYAEQARSLLAGLPATE